MATGAQERATAYAVGCALERLAAETLAVALCLALPAALLAAALAGVPAFVAAAVSALCPVAFLYHRRAWYRTSRFRALTGPAMVI
ncbi:MAG TPA: hypothetical protein VKD22_03765 [Ramlibacter sp.]|nr:hypothetical protein [Ramlibacter sp.]